MEQVSATMVFGGALRFLKHASKATGMPMVFSVFVPPGPGPFPVVYWLSGLTCTANNFTEKAGAYRTAAELGLIVVAPDTSPRGEGVADDPAYDLGQGAGFYLDATEAPWAPHFRMESYITDELIAVVEAGVPANGRRSVFGHSMGGHGALTLAMRHKGLYRSVSAFAPIASPTRCPWGEKAFTAYLGADRDKWRAHDASHLMAEGAARDFDDILIDQGLADSFLVGQLRPELLEEAARAAGQKLTLRRHAGYDHSYYFIQTFLSEHLAFHARRLGAG
jgi:S-formylglutathione hydrolase